MKCFFPKTYFNSSKKLPSALSDVFLQWYSTPRVSCTHWLFSWTEIALHSAENLPRTMVPSFTLKNTFELFSHRKTIYFPLSVAAISHTTLFSIDFCYSFNCRILCQACGEVEEEKCNHYTKSEKNWVLNICFLVFFLEKFCSVCNGRSTFNRLMFSLRLLQILVQILCYWSANIIITPFMVKQTTI